MKLNKVKADFMVVAFPSFGMVGNVALEFLKENLNVIKIGKIFSENEPPMMIIHNKELIEPISIYYDKKHRLILVQGLTKAKGSEFLISKKIDSIARMCGVKTIITIDGASSVSGKVYFTSNNDKEKERLKKLGFEELSNGAVLGVSASLLNVSDSVVSVFVETESQLPDSRAASKAIIFLDKMLKLNVDYKPLLDQAKIFEKKVNKILKKKIQAGKDSEVDYVG